MDTHALVILSGGQDSGSCLLWALAHFERVSALAFDYGQRHRVELDCAADLCGLHDVPLHVARVTSLAEVASRSALINHSAELRIDGGHANLPTSFVPGRNLLFLTLGAAYATQVGATELVTGVCQNDHTGYPDCRDETIRALHHAIVLGMDLDPEHFTIHTPLMFRSKAETWQLVHDVAGDEGVAEIIHHTHTCYDGDHTTLHPWGYGCGKCPACDGRRAGWEAYSAAREQ